MPSGSEILSAVLLSKFNPWSLKSRTQTSALSPQACRRGVLLYVAVQYCAMGYQACLPRPTSLLFLLNAVNRMSYVASWKKGGSIYETTKVVRCSTTKGRSLPALISLHSSRTQFSTFPTSLSFLGIGHAQRCSPLQLRSRNAKSSSKILYGHLKKYFKRVASQSELVQDQ